VSVCFLFDFPEKISDVVKKREREIRFRSFGRSSRERGEREPFKEKNDR
jgi:hypothetical protein